MKKGNYQRLSQKHVEIENRVRGTPEAEEDNQPLSHEQKEILKWLNQVRFKKAVFGGLKEADVWKKIAELNTMYEAALSAERLRYDVLLEERVETAVRQMAKQMYHQSAGAAEQEKAGDGA